MKYFEFYICVKDHCDWFVISTAVFENQDDVRICRDWLIPIFRELQYLIPEDFKSVNYERHDDE